MTMKPPQLITYMTMFCITHLMKMFKYAINALSHACAICIHFENRNVNIG